jgi:hypothetical protein
MRWEHQLKDALGDLARSADAVPANAASERRLLEAFDARHEGESSNQALQDVPRRATWYLAAAASVALFVGGAWWAAGRHEVVPAPVAQSASTQATPPARPAVPLPAPPAGIASEALAPRPVIEGTTTPRPASRPRPTPATLASNATDDADDFVELPAAERLPRLESGMIVRVELDATSLPAYGFPIMPDSTLRPVTADVLVGQDGQPRAIRLVSMQSGSRRRQ